MPQLPEVEAAVSSITKPNTCCDINNCIDTCDKEFSQCDGSNGWVFNCRKNKAFSQRYSYSSTEHKILRKHKYRQCWQRLLGPDIKHNRSLLQASYKENLQRQHESRVMDDLVDELKKSQNKCHVSDSMSGKQENHTGKQENHTGQLKQKPILSFGSLPSHQKYTNKFFPRSCRRSYKHNRLLGGLQCSPPRRKARCGINFTLKQRPFHTSLMSHVQKLYYW